MERTNEEAGSPKTVSGTLARRVVLWGMMGGRKGGGIERGWGDS